MIILVVIILTFGTVTPETPTRYEYASGSYGEMFFKFPTVAKCVEERRGWIARAMKDAKGRTFLLTECITGEDTALFSSFSAPTPPATPAKAEPAIRS